SWSSSRVRLGSLPGGAWRRPTGGSWNDSAPPVPKSKVSCHASPCSARRPRGDLGSTTTGGATTSGGASATVAAAGTAMRAGAAGRVGTGARLSAASRAEVTRTTAAQETRVTKGTPTGKGATGRESPSTRRTERRPSRATRRRGPPGSAGRRAAARDRTSRARSDRTRRRRAPRSPSPRSTSGRCGGGDSAEAGLRSRRGRPSDLQDEREHQGLPAKPLVDEVPHGGAHARRDGLPVERALGRTLGERRQDHGPELLEQRLVLLDAHEPARGDRRPGDDRARAIDGDRDRDQAVLGEELAVAEHDGADLADGLAVDEDAARGEASHDARRRL